MPLDPRAPTRDGLPATLAALEAGVESGLHLGGQLYVSLHGEVVADLAFGESRPGRPMDREDLALWMSSTKPVTAVAVGQLWERGRLGLDDPVAEHLPEFAERGKEGITIRHLLTHTAGIRMLDVGWPRDDGETIVARICAARPEPGWRPGRRAGYHLASSWFVLGELVRRIDGREISRYVRDEIFEPLGMDDCWIGMPEERWRAYGDRVTPMWNTEVSPPESLGWESAARVTRPSPGGNGRGPLHQLGRFYEALLAGGAGERGRILTPQTVEAMTARHRVGMLDRTFRHLLDWGLGFIVNSAHYGAERPPYGYGPHASLRTFGHSGYRSSSAYADPEHGLVVALAVNGTPSDELHAQRFERTTAAIYEDLKLDGSVEELPEASSRVSEASARASAASRKRASRQR